MQPGTNFASDMLDTLQEVHRVGTLPTGAVALLVARLEEHGKGADDITLGELRLELDGVRAHFEGRAQ
ncbi:hypothetical protein [Thioalkalivibrio sp. ALJ8]|uniref:hypothetical protein n=1 Tax=Thioalkalivibrio sp. ALJ8 TaxID=1158757 RepID=UPI00038226BE|nr:hypothetical protein [Thioalkalivibrio sp. ALJ8]